MVGDVHKPHPIRGYVHTLHKQGFHLGGRGHLPPLESYVPPPLELVLHMPTVHGAPPKVLNRPLWPLLQKLLDETLHKYDVMLL